MCGASYLIKDEFNGLVVGKDEPDCNARIIKYLYSLNTDKRKIIEEVSMSYKNELAWSNIANLYITIEKDVKIK